ncbi:hypothetical protein CVIRNUC_005612 [Coccomyxa viridis]|uniref:CBM20 domain-containing protein n=1 Tax=Coccomyxa viridis TaxID=1274662 RepID=A0AAV1I504_9CHLO|nr:hypothetical protein CVIRNUC_005612 [Coccomyxa viridis]
MVPQTHRCQAHLTSSWALRLLHRPAARSVKMQLLPGSQKAVPTSFVLHALAEDGQRPRGQQQSRVRPPLQRQRPGPQRPMDGRQRQQQRPQRQTPPFKQDSGSQLQEQQGSSPADQPQQARGLQRGQQQPGSDSRVASVGGPSQQMTAVSFCLQFDTQYGQRMRLVGSHHNLGAWQLRDGPDLSWTEGNNWRAVIELPAGTVHEYKYVLLDSHSGQALNWQRGNNSVLAIKAGEDRIEVMDNWEGQPGAAVMTKGASASRERRLLEWANDMEALVNTQRNDLRRSRMELAAATEDANQTRQELRVVRAELARSRAQQATERRKAAEMAAQNQRLQQHLQETTSSFREALQLVESLMGAEDILDDVDDQKDGDEPSAATLASIDDPRLGSLQQAGARRGTNGAVASEAESSASRLDESAAAKSR